MSQTDTMLDRLTAIVGADHVLTDEAATRPYRTGYRSGSGDVLAVVHPGTLVALWQCTRAAVEAGAVIVPQAANTGLT